MGQGLVATAAAALLLLRAASPSSAAVKEPDTFTSLTESDADTRSFIFDAARHFKTLLDVRGYTGPPDPHDFVFTFYSSRGRYAVFQGFHDAMIDRLIERALREGDDGARAELYRRIQRRAYDFVPSRLYTDFYPAYKAETSR